MFRIVQGRVLRLGRGEGDSLHGGSVDMSLGGAREGGELFRSRGGLTADEERDLPGYEG